MGAPIGLREPSFSAPSQPVTSNEALVPEPGFQLASLPPLSPHPAEGQFLLKSKSDPV